jgi:hypothetical protein
MAKVLGESGNQLFAQMQMQEQKQQEAKRKANRQQAIADSELMLKAASNPDVKNGEFLSRFAFANKLMGDQPLVGDIMSGVGTYMTANAFDDIREAEKGKAERKEEFDKSALSKLLGRDLTLSESALVKDGRSDDVLELNDKLIMRKELDEDRAQVKLERDRLNEEYERGEASREALTETLLKNFDYEKYGISKEMIMSNPDVALPLFSNKIKQDMNEEQVNELFTAVGGTMKDMGFTKELLIAQQQGLITPQMMGVMALQNKIPYMQQDYHEAMDDLLDAYDSLGQAQLTAKEQLDKTLITDIEARKFWENNKGDENDLEWGEISDQEQEDARSAALNAKMSDENFAKQYDMAVQGALQSQLKVIQTLEQRVKNFQTANPALINPIRITPAREQGLLQLVKEEDINGVTYQTTTGNLYITDLTSPTGKRELTEQELARYNRRQGRGSLQQLTDPGTSTITDNLPTNVEVNDVAEASDEAPTDIRKSINEKASRYESLLGQMLSKGAKLKSEKEYGQSALDKFGELFERGLFPAPEIRGLFESEEKSSLIEYLRSKGVDERNAKRIAFDIDPADGTDDSVPFGFFMSDKEKDESTILDLDRKISILEKLMDKK